jgi:hypothetical protein
VKIHHEVDPRPLRAAKYQGIGEQLDAAMKGFDALITQGVQLPPETVAWVEHCKSIKARFQKP